MDRDDAIRAKIADLENSYDFTAHYLRFPLADLERSNTIERLTRLTHYITALKWSLGQVDDSALD